jgi:Cytochrome c7 and related cytochrome c
MRNPLGWQKWLLWMVAGAGTLALGLIMLSGHATKAASPPGFVTTGIFTPAHPTAYAALQDFIDVHPEHPVQPIAYTHTVHLAKGLPCTFCHVGVDSGPEPRIPGINVCMSCHGSIATDRPEIKKIAAYKERGEDIPWVRVYNYSDSAHVRFNHAPHISAGVDCASCHGDLTKQTTAERKVNMNMGFCINCHTQKKVSIDCETCHY